jgi:hypothetical protein
MILRIIMVAAVLIAAVLVFAAMKPSTLHLQRSIAIKAPPEKIFPLVNDFHNGNAWQPLEKDDSSILRTYSGPAAGVGAVSEWQGSGSTGKGRMLITESVPNSRASVAVDFVKPFQAHNINVFTREPVGDSTKVTLELRGY